MAKWLKRAILLGVPVLQLPPQVKILEKHRRKVERGISWLQRKYRRLVYRAQEGFVNLDSARQSKIDPNERDHCTPCKASEEDRFGEAAASPNSQNLTERGIVRWERRMKYWEGFLGLGILLYWVRELVRWGLCG